MTSCLIAFLLFVVAFIVIPIGYQQFEAPKIIISETVIDFLFLDMLFKQGIGFYRKLNRNQIIVTGFLILLTVYQVLFLETPFTLFGDPTRMQGIVLLWNLLLFSLVVSNSSVLKFKPQWYTFILLMVFILSLLIGNPNGRAVATLGEPNSLAAFVIFLWPFLYFSNTKSKKYRLSVRIFSIVCTLAIIFLSGSRSGLIAFAVQLFFFVASSLGKIKLKPVVLVTSFLIILTYTLPFIGTTLYENRADVWRTAVITGMQLPILGGGFGNMEILLNQATHELHNNLIGYSLDSAHNIFLDWWVQGGIAGVFILCSFLILAIKNFYKQNKRFELLLLFGLITSMSFNPASVVTLIEFWWLIGTSFSQKIPDQPQYGIDK